VGPADTGNAAGNAARRESFGQTRWKEVGAKAQGRKKKVRARAAWGAGSQGYAQAIIAQQIGQGIGGGQTSYGGSAQNAPPQVTPIIPSVPTVTAPSGPTVGTTVPPSAPIDYGAPFGRIDGVPFMPQR